MTNTHMAYTSYFHFLHFPKALRETTFDIEEDVDFIYREYFKPFVSAVAMLRQGKQIDIRNFIHAPPSSLPDVLEQQKFFLGSTDSSKLKSEHSKEAHAVQPVKIICGMFSSGNQFYITKKAKWVIISMNPSNLSMFLKYPDLSTASKHLQKFMSNEFSEHRVKASIAHELNHWIDDSLHSFFLSQKSLRALELNKPEMILMKQRNVDLTYFEINSQIAGIKQLKRELKSEWDSLSFEDILFKYTSLWSIAHILYGSYGKDIVEIWANKLFKRMKRENLVGSSMKPELNLHVLFKEHEN